MNCYRFEEIRLSTNDNLLSPTQTYDNHMMNVSFAMQSDGFLIRPAILRVITIKFIVLVRITRCLFESLNSKLELQTLTKSLASITSNI